uniref:Heme oxygenase 2 n=1 Tax=Cyprinodon variegatus TaxID=28743 RepID=A0A3Q2E1M1_CYPVA
FFVSTSSADLSEMLLAGTKESHTKTEISPLGRDFYRGIVKKDVLKVSLQTLYFIYSAMEDELERNKDHPYLAPIYFPTELYRREALAQDLQYFYGADWESLISPSAATKLWVKRIREVGKKDPGMLLAHCYVRYIGDLSGGHLLNNVAKKVLKLPATGEGLKFYTFEGITSQKGFKQLYRSKLNEVDLEMETKVTATLSHLGTSLFNDFDASDKSISTWVCFGGAVVSAHHPCMEALALDAGDLGLNQTCGPFLHVSPLLSYPLSCQPTVHKNKPLVL